MLQEVVLITHILDALYQLEKHGLNIKLIEEIIEK